MKMNPNKIMTKVYAVAAFCLSAMSLSAQCLAPGSVTISNVESTSLTATWTASPSDPTGIEYNWEIRTSGAGGSGAVGLSFSGSTINGLLSTDVENLTFDTDYFFYVRYKCAEDNNSSWVSSAAIETANLETPVTTDATNVLDVSMRANWDPVAGASGYFLDVATDIDFITYVAGYQNVYTTNNSMQVTGLDPNTTYYYRVRAQGTGGNGQVTTGNSNVTSRTTLGPQLGYALWNGTAWEPIANQDGPDDTLDVIIAADYNTSEDGNGDFAGKTLTIYPGATLTIAPMTSVEIVNEVVNQNTGNEGLVVESNGHLVQLHSGTNNNSGGSTVERISSPLYRLDYTMWSSPTAETSAVTDGQTLQDFSPMTAETRFYTYNSADDVFETTPRTNQFIAGEGYLIRIRNNHPSFVSSAVPGTTWTGVFEGKPFSGDLAVDLDTSGFGYNMVGNPYPSEISSDELLANNLNITGTLYFWRRRNNDTTTNEPYSSYYATYTVVGGVGTGNPVDGTTNTSAPSPYIQVGQGFLVQVEDGFTGAQSLLFDNTLRSADNPGAPFFRSSTVVNKDRIWLNLSNGSTTTYNQTLVGYMDGAINGVDRADGKYINDGSVALTSLLNNTEYIIQGRAPFNVADVVPLNFKTPLAASYTIAIDHVDGLFLGDQNIYLKDNLTNVTHDLKAGAYTFATEAGNFNSRFELLYENSLAVADPTLDVNGVAVFKANGEININAGSIAIASVKVFDIRGRLLAEKNNINANETSINAGSTKQVLIVQITSVDNKTISKKIVN